MAAEEIGSGDAQRRNRVVAGRLATVVATFARRWQLPAPSLLFAAGEELLWRELRAVWRPVTVLSIGLVLVSAAAVAFVAVALTPLPFGMAFVLGAILASTDPVAVTALGRRLSLPPRVQVVRGGLPAQGEPARAGVGPSDRWQLPEALAGPLPGPAGPRIKGVYLSRAARAHAGAMTTTTLPGGTFTMANDLTVTRVGYGAMQLAGPHVFGPPADRDGALAVLRELVELGITHIDTSDFYGPHVTNRIIKEALHPYPESLRIVTKVGAMRDAKGGWPVALAPEQLRGAMHSNLENLGLDTLDVVNLRVGGFNSPEPGSIAEPFAVLAELQRQGLIKHLGLSTVNAEQIAEAQSIAPVVCVQNFYNIANRADDALVDSLAAQGIAYVPYFPLGGFNPVQSDTVAAVAARHGSTSLAVALAWLLHRSPNILLIPGTSSVAHLRDNVAAAGLVLSEADLTQLDSIGR